MFVYYKCYIPIEFTFLKELMLTRQVNQRGPLFVVIVFFKIKALNSNQMSAVDAMIINDVYEPQQYCCFKH